MGPGHGHWNTGALEHSKGREQSESSVSATLSKPVATPRGPETVAHRPLNSTHPLVRIIDLVRRVHSARSLDQIPPEVVQFVIFFFDLVYFLIILFLSDQMGRTWI